MTDTLAAPLARTQVVPRHLTGPQNLDAPLIARLLERAAGFEGGGGGPDQRRRRPRSAPDPGVARPVHHQEGAGPPRPFAHRACRRSPERPHGTPAGRPPLAIRRQRAGADRPTRPAHGQGRVALAGAAAAGAGDNGPGRGGAHARRAVSDPHPGGALRVGGGVRTISRRLRRGSRADAPLAGARYPDAPSSARRRNRSAGGRGSQGRLFPAGPQRALGSDGGARGGDGRLMLQSPPVEAVILDAQGLPRSGRRIAHEGIERQPDLAQLSLLGIVTRGVPLAERLAATLAELEGVRPPVLPLDVRAYRDDLPRAAAAPLPVLPRTAVDGRPVLLVDDGLFNGRTVRAAIDALIACGRPKQIQLAVLVDRGHRDLPIRPDYIGKNVPTSRQEWVEVHLRERDGEDAVRILERPER